eukprot:6469423-Amphidinium_carterae.1
MASTHDSRANWTRALAEDDLRPLPASSLAPSMALSNSNLSLSLMCSGGGGPASRSVCGP